MNSLSPTAGLVLGQGVLTGDLRSGVQSRDRNGKGKVQRPEVKRQGWGGGDCLTGDDTQVCKQGQAPHF